MSSLEHAGWIIVASMASMALGAWFHWLFSKDNCKSCGLAELKEEIHGMCCLVRELAARAGISVKEQLEIESMGKG
jgi:hypothetical protein